MGFLDHLFDNEWRRRSDINVNAERLKGMRAASRRNRSRDAKQDRRIDELEASHARLAAGRYGETKGSTPPTASKSSSNQSKIRLR